MKHQFKPFNNVLVRMDYRIHQCVKDEPFVWSAATFSHIEKTDDGRTRYCANSILWDECIPYNENTAHLVGTNQPYKEPEPKVWKVTCHKNNEVFHFTNNELKHFIETAVLNKDIQWFTTTYDGNNN
mgnify:FL=1